MLILPLQSAKWHRPVTPALGKLEQENGGFGTRLGYKKIMFQNK